jgi:4-hydroxybenzoate polyprenyltransferase
VRAIIISLRPGQWIKNSLLFAAIIFTGQLFNSSLFLKSFLGFLVFCFLSSASYLINDLLDLRYDRIHSQKRNRPLAKGDLKPEYAFQLAVFLVFIGLLFSLFLSFSLFLLGTIFIIIHILYSSILKKFAVLDILAIASSFIIRTFAGEVLTGFHVPIWLMLTVIFLSLFIAAGKRRSELVLEGVKARPALLSYRRQLLDFYTSTFANAALICYALFTFFTEPARFSESLTRFLSVNFPQALGRKWLMAATIPFVIFGMMRYAQLIYEKQKGEKPEKMLAGDLLLSLAVIGWGITVIFIIYVI